MKAVGRDSSPTTPALSATPPAGGDVVNRPLGFSLCSLCSLWLIVLDFLGGLGVLAANFPVFAVRSEERRVGKECRL